MAGQPIDNAVVEILIGCQVSGEIVLCEDQTLVDYTNSEGKVWFNIGGGGCCKVPGACEIRANGVTLRIYDVVVSADHAYSGNVGIPGGGDGDVDPIDLGAFITAYQGGSGPASCHDYNNSGLTDPADLGTFIEAYKGGANFCLLR
jgi:hypothetical protein